VTSMGPWLLIARTAISSETARRRSLMYCSGWSRARKDEPMKARAIVR
jgi:hypothetical protein